jgi:putative ABC transport system ATP-binding protein
VIKGQANKNDSGESNSTMKNVIETRQLARDFVMGEVTVNALRGVDLTVTEGDFVAIMGASGSGKSTLMNLLGCLDRPTSGEYLLEGQPVATMSKDEYARIRNEKIGFVFQGFNLLSRTSTIENVELPLLYDETDRIGDPRQAAVDALTQVGLGNRLDHEPNQLSGGQQQRVAIARALVNKPSLILADEPTGNLDSRTSLDVMSLFQELNDRGITIVLVTHETDIALCTKRIVEVRDGLIIRDVQVQNRRNAGEELHAIAASAAHSGSAADQLSHAISSFVTTGIPS